MKKSLKKVLILFFCISIVLLSQNIVFAIPSPTDAAGWSGESTVYGAAEKVMGAIISIMQVVGVGVAIIMIIYVAIKYMTAAPSEKAEFKKSATAYVVGAVILFATSGILGIIKNFAGILATSTSA